MHRLEKHHIVTRAVIVSDLPNMPQKPIFRQMAVIGLIFWPGRHQTEVSFLHVPEEFHPDFHLVPRACGGKPEGLRPRYPLVSVQGYQRDGHIPLGRFGRNRDHTCPRGHEIIRHRRKLQGEVHRLKPFLERMAFIEDAVTVSRPYKLHVSIFNGLKFYSATG